MKSRFLAAAFALAPLLGAVLPVIYAHAQNSPEATAAARRHLAEKRGAQAAGPTSATPASAPAHRATAATGWAAQLAGCKAAAGINVIQREKCVWTHCNGHWGEGDCPPGSDWPPKFEKPKFEKSGTTPSSANR